MKLFQYLAPVVLSAGVLSGCGGESTETASAPAPASPRDQAPVSVSPASAPAPTAADCADCGMPEGSSEGTPAQTAPAGSDGTAVVRSKLVPVGRAAPAFSLKHPGGEQVSLASLRGKVVLLSFWKPGCPPCQVEAPHLQRLHRKYFAKGVRVVGIAPLTPPAEIHAFVKQHQVTYSMLVDPGDKVAESYGRAGYPTIILIDRRGIVRFHKAGFRAGDEEIVEREVGVLIGSGP